MPKKKTSGLFFSLSCGCGDSTAVSVSDSSDHRYRQPLAPQSSGSTLTHTTTASSSSPWNFYEEDQEEEDSISSSTTPSFSGLLRQLNKLEQNLRAWSNKKKYEFEEQQIHEPQQHRYSTSSSIAESVAVVKESEDPFSDFRSSMLQMIVEKELDSGNELRELLHRFLSLNSPKHHQVILKAFAEIWDEVFSGYEQTPDIIAHSFCSRRLHRHGRYS